MSKRIIPCGYPKPWYVSVGVVSRLGAKGNRMFCNSHNDKELLASLESKLQIVRDRTQGVAEGYSGGFFMWGEGGTSKSFTVEETLKRLGTRYKLSNSRITGRGLFELLRDYPDVVHVCEDVETLFSDKNSLGVLRSALWGQADENGKQERLVVWQIAGNRDEFIFTGGIILIANCCLSDIPQLRALKTRIASVQYRPSNEEIAALIRRIATDGHRHGTAVLPPKECQEVADELLSSTQRMNRNLDIRLYINACQDRLQWANGSSATHWKVLVASRLQESALASNGGPESRESRKGTEIAIVQKIAGLPPQKRLQAWVEETGKSQAALYRRLNELHNSHFSQFLAGPHLGEK